MEEQAREGSPGGAMEEQAGQSTPGGTSWVWKRRREVHHGVMCDKCSMSPVVGRRFKRKDSDYDLCSACFDKLPPAERADYERILAKNRTAESASEVEGSEAAERPQPPQSPIARWMKRLGPQGADKPSKGKAKAKAEASRATKKQDGSEPLSPLGKDQALCAPDEIRDVLGLSGRWEVETLTPKLKTYSGGGDVFDFDAMEAALQEEYPHAEDDGDGMTPPHE